MKMETIIKIFLYGVSLGRAGTDDVEALLKLQEIIVESKKEVNYDRP